MVGRTIAHYEISAKLGEGGMGAVYRARDTRLGREVALKILPEQFARDPQRMGRFQREAHLLASLNHPNIAGIHGLEEQDGVHALVMELAEGPTLEDRIGDGAIPLEEALSLARQMAEALEYAHEHGVVHRDLKPANVRVTHEGIVKVLDFGLAKAMEDEPAAADPADSPTLTIGATKAGVILGTAAYMAPEQARGKRVDKRADIWAFGVVLYEMLTGRRPFAGETISDTLAQVLTKEPEWSGIPAKARPLLMKCLEKDPKKRLRDIGDMEAMLVDIPVQVARHRERSLPWAVAIVAVLAAMAVSLAHFRQAPGDAPVRKFAISSPGSLGGNPAISPDGMHIAFVEAGPVARLWVQDLDQDVPRAIEGTEGSSWPFWSPDSAFIGFAAGGELRRTSVRGGPPSRVCDLGSDVFYGGTWSPDGEVIVFSAGAAPLLYQVPARGGTPAVVVSPQSPGNESGGLTGGIVTPHFLPAGTGRRVLAFAYGTGVQTTMMIEDLESGKREILGPGCLPYYSPSGHIVYQASPYKYDLWALPFSLDNLRGAGEAFPIVEDAAGPTVAGDGTLTYLNVAGSGSEQRQPGQQRLVWLGRDGGKTGESGVAAEVIVNLALSPDGSRVAVAALEGSNLDVWTYDPVRGVRTRLSTAPQYDTRPVWSPDGETVAFSSNRAGNNDIFFRQADGIGDETTAVATPRDELLSDWSRDGNYILYSVAGGTDTGSDLWYLERGPNGGGWKPHLFLEAPAEQITPKLSPDGRYVAYLSNESGRFEVYVRPFPEGNRQWTVSNNGAEGQRWSGNGSELFYVEGGDTLMAVKVQTARGFSADSASRLFQRPGLIINAFSDPYDVSADGQRFLVVEASGGQATEGSIRVVLNWFAEFRARE